MLLQIILASILTLNVGYRAQSTDSHAETSNLEPAKHKYDSNVNKISTNDATKDTSEKGRHLEPAGALESKQQLPYITDNWSYQPFIEYSNVSPHSQSITQIAFGKDAVEALRKSKEPQQNNQNVLYLQSEVAKPVDNQLPAQPEPNGNIVYVDPGKNQQNIIYLSPDITFANQPHNAQQPILYYTPVPQQQSDNVVFITPQPNIYNPTENYNQPIQQNYYQPNHMYLVTHIQSPTKNQQENNNPENVKPIAEEKPKKGTNADKSDQKNDNKEKESKDEEKDHDKKKHDDEHVLVESSTAKAIIEEYERHYVKRRKNVDIKNDGESGTTQNPYPSATTPLGITNPASLSSQPIVVADLEENNLEYDDKIYSTTQSTIKTVKTSATIYRPTQPIIVTPRPLGTTFLAPITAGVQLQSVQSPQKPKDSVVVEIQKSVPYYLGKFEFIQNDSPQETSKREEIKQNVDLGANLLKYSLERLPHPETLISEYNNSGPILTQLAYKTVHDQEQESGQFEYKVQSAPYQQILIQNPQLEVTKLEKIYNSPHVQHHPVQHHVFEHEQPAPIRQVYVQPPAQILSVPIKTVSDYIQKSQVQQIQPLIQQQFIHSQPVLLEPFPPVTRLIPQYVPLKHHQEVQKAPMKSYSYAPSYQTQKHHAQHHHHNVQHNYQINHGHTSKKQKNLPVSYQQQPIANNFYHTIRLNDYIGMKPPKGPTATQGPPFKASQHLQTIHEYLPATQLTQQQVRKYRNPRHSFESGIRLEYGFMPPLIPSIEIDEYGKPIEKTEA